MSRRPGPARALKKIKILVRAQAASLTGYKLQSIRYYRRKNIC